MAVRSLKYNGRSGRLDAVVDAGETDNSTLVTFDMHFHASELPEFTALMKALVDHSKQRLKEAAANLERIQTP